MREKWLWYLILAIYAFFFLSLLGGTVRAQDGKLYIYVKLCKETQCVEKYLEVAEDVNELQCVYGSMGTIAEWTQKNMPLYKPVEWGCTHVRRQDI